MTDADKKKKWEAVQAIDLSSVKKKLRERKGWWGGRKSKVDKTEKEYRQFLYLIAINPGQTIVPWSQPLDDFWHEHILDTRKYQQDCQTIFGEFIHHNPHLPQGTAEHTKASKETKKVYKEAFQDKAKSKDSDSPGCGGDSTFIAVFCAAAPISSCSSAPSSSPSCSSGSSSSCGSASCGGGGGGGGCGGGGCGSS